jgi:hypothetical protein
MKDDVEDIPMIYIVVRTSRDCRGCVHSSSSGDAIVLTLPVIRTGSGRGSASTRRHRTFARETGVGG